MSYRILNIETATESGSIALSQGSEILSQSLGTIPQAHSRSILPAIEALLAKAQVSLSMLDAIAVGKGPGSFTGVRLGLSVAQGLCFGLDIPCIPVSTLAILAYRARVEAQSRGVPYILPAMDARMSEVYMGLYEAKDGQVINLVPDCVKNPNELHYSLFEEYLQKNDERLIAIGTGWQAAYQASILQASLLKPVCILEKATPDAANLAELAIIAMQKGEQCAPEECMPAYCRDKVTF